jgi:hypothetical protein
MYQDDCGLPLGVLILEGGDLAVARLTAAITGLDEGAQFRSARRLDEATSARVPAAAIGRMLSWTDATKLVAREDTMLGEGMWEPARRQVA